MKFKEIKEGTILRYWTLKKANAAFEPDLRITLIMRSYGDCTVMKQSPYGVGFITPGSVSYGVGVAKAQDTVIQYLRSGYHMVQGEVVVKTYEEARKEAGIVLPEDITEERFRGIGDEDE